MAASHCGWLNKLLSSFSSSKPYSCNGACFKKLLNLLCYVDLGLCDPTVTMYPAGAKHALTSQMFILVFMFSNSPQFCNSILAKYLNSRNDANSRILLWYLAKLQILQRGSCTSTIFHNELRKLACLVRFLAYHLTRLIHTLWITNVCQQFHLCRRCC